MKRHRFIGFMVFAFVLIAIVGLVNTLAHSFPTTIQEEFQNRFLRTNEKHMIDAPFIGQMERYPTGCESTSAVMALQYFGVDISVDDFIDYYLDLGTAPYEYDGKLYGDSPWDYFLGSPYEGSGWGCYSPVIQSALQKVLIDSDFSAEYYLGTPLQELCSEYIDNEIPVILWATMEMREASYTSTWLTPDGNQVTWISPEHCLLLVGYDNEYYYFNDSRQGKQTAYSKREVEIAYESMLSQAVVITPME